MDRQDYAYRQPQQWTWFGLQIIVYWLDLDNFVIVYFLMLVALLWQFFHENVVNKKVV
jgi:hypothetical protein